MLQSLPTHFPDWSRTIKEPGADLILDPSAPLELPGKSDSQWRKWIGNMVPPLAAKAIAEEMLHSLELTYMGQTFELRGNGEIWVERLEQRQARVAALVEGRKRFWRISTP
jgi:predicted amidohydrolase